MRLKGNVVIAKRKNRDRSWTFYLRWHTEKYGGGWNPHSERLFRTEPHPKQKSLREWCRKAANAVAQRQADFDGLDEPEARGERKRQLVALCDAIEYYSVWIRGDELHAAPIAESTADERERHLLRFLNFMGDNFPTIRTVWRLSHRHTARFREHRRATGIRDSTLAKECAHLQAFLDWCYNPIRAWMKTPLRALPQDERKHLHTQPKQHRILSDETVRKVIAAQPTPVVFVLATTGMRQGELRNLKVQDWHEEDGTLRIRSNGAERTKRHTRDLPVGNKLQATLERISADRYGELPMFAGKDDMPLTSNLINRMVKPFGCTAKELRRWFNAKLIDSGCPESYAKMLLGHTLPRQEAAYLPCTPEKLGRWMQEVENTILASF